MLDVLIVGGGPVGLFLGILLARTQLSFAILEARPTLPLHSRAIGIHPPALRAFEAAGLTATLLAAGVPIRRGLVLGERGPLGALPFEAADPTYPFILSVPQRTTEQVLERRLAELAPDALHRGARVLSVRQCRQASHVTVQHEGHSAHWQARWIVGADGWRSRVRQEAGIAFPGGVYADKYLMGDFPDTTPFGADAMIALTRGGVVESFPLPGGERRWVAHVGHKLPAAPEPSDLTRLIRQRTRLHVPEGECHMLSAFEVRRHLASQLIKGQTVLVGDAGHVVSPIGGQGMNLGWLDAAALVELLTREPTGQAEAWKFYERPRRRAAWRAARQAELNMGLGRPTGVTGQRAREALVRRLLRPQGQRVLARAFTMGWL